MVSATDQELLELLDLPKDLPGQPGETQIELSEEEKRFAEERRTTLGGTDSAALLGFSTYRNAWDVAAEKKGLLDPWGGNERTEIGRLLEEPVARAYAARTGQKLRKVSEVVRDRVHPFLGGHPDRLIVGKKKGVEVKTVDWGFEKWSKPGEPLRVPRDYFVQCQHYMMIQGYEEWDIVALFGLQRIRWYTLFRNEVVIKALREKDVEFWERFVVGPDLPPMEGKRAERYVRERFPEPTGPTFVVANEEQRELVAKWREAKREANRWKKEHEKYRVQMLAAIGDAQGMVVEAGDVITAKKNKDTTESVTDYQGLLVHYADKHDFNIETEDIQRFTQSLVTKQGARVLREKGKDD